MQCVNLITQQKFSSHALSLERKLLMLYDGLPMKGYNIIYTVRAFIFAGFYFHLFAAPNIFADLNFRQL